MKDPIAILRFPTSPVVLIRTSSILVVLLMAGHLSAYPWAANHGLRETQLIDSMKSVDFDFLGARSTYWNLYFGWGILIGILLLTLSITLWLLSDLVRLAPDDWVSSLESSPRAVWRALISLIGISMFRRFYSIWRFG